MLFAKSSSMRQLAGVRENNMSWETGEPALYWVTKSKHALISFIFVYVGWHSGVHESMP